MSKVVWDGTTLLAPVPVVLATVGDMENSNIITIAWTGICSSKPPMTYISVRPERYSHQLLEKNAEFVINLVTDDLVRKTDSIGVKSGRDIDKFQEYRLTKAEASKVACPLIEECPVNVECVVKQVISLGSHDMYLAEIVAVNVNEELLDEKGKLNLRKAGLVAYSHGEYFSLGKKIGKFGYSVKKNGKKKPVLKKKFEDKKVQEEKFEDKKPKAKKNEGKIITGNKVSTKNGSIKKMTEKKASRKPKLRK